MAMGQFYEGIKAQTKVMLNDPLPGQKASPEYLRVKYLRGKQTMVECFTPVRRAVGTCCFWEMGGLKVGILSLASLAAGGFRTRGLGVFRDRPGVLSTLSTGCKTQKLGLSKNAFLVGGAIHCGKQVLRPLSSLKDRKGPCVEVSFRVSDRASLAAHSVMSRPPVSERLTLLRKEAILELVTDLLFLIYVFKCTHM